MDSQDNYEMSDAFFKAWEWRVGDIWRSHNGVLYRLLVEDDVPRIQKLQSCGEWATSGTMGQLPHTPMRRKCAALPPAEAVAWMIRNPQEAVVVEETGLEYHSDAGVFWAGSLRGCVPIKPTRPVRGYW